MGLFDTNVGALLIGVFLNTFLFGVVAFQYASYYNTKFHDPMWIRATVGILFSLDTVHSASLGHLYGLVLCGGKLYESFLFTWFYLLLYFIKSTINVLEKVPVWPYPFTVFATAITAFMTQIFLAYRGYRLVKTKSLFGGILSLSFGNFVLGCYCGVKAFQTTTLPQIYILKPFLVPWLCLEVTTDCIISGMLLLYLSRARTGFKGADTVITRLMRTSIQTGLFSGLFSILCLVFFITRPDTHFFATFGIPISRVYTNCLMDTLITRENLRGVLSGEAFNTLEGDRRLSSFSRSQTATNLQLHVRTEIHTDVGYPQLDSQKKPNLSTDNY